MPIASEIDTAAAMFRQNDAMLSRSIEGLTPEEWQTRPNDTSNCVLWIVGHIVWARSMALKFLGSSWSSPWLPLFARGAKLVEPNEYPSPQEIEFAWNEVRGILAAAMETASTQTLSAPAGEKSPSFDGKSSGMVSFLAYHEAYHVGQAAYIRRWLGHGQVIG